MSTSDGDELTNIVVSLRRHLQRRQRMGVGSCRKLRWRRKPRRIASEEAPDKVERRLGARPMQGK